MSWRKEEGPLSIQEAFHTLTLDSLKPMAALLAAAPPHRKGELVAFLTKAMQEPQRVRDLYEKLEPLEQAAVQEAAHDPKGWLHADRFRAKYGRLPSFNEPPPKGKASFYDYGYGRHSRPKTLALFFPHYDYVPTDLRSLLLAFVPAPRPYALPTRSEPPAAVPMTRKTWTGSRHVADAEETPLPVRETAREAVHDLQAVLRLVELGRVRVSDKKRQPTAASRQAVAGVLQGGDFYTPEDQAEYKDDPAGDLGIKTFAWPMIVQAAGLAEKAGDNLRPTPAGRKALTRPAHEVIRAAWKKWLAATLLDEFSRVEAVKGQSKGQLSALTTRRKAVVDGLAQCPPGQWVGTDDFFRFLRATDRDFVLAHRVYNLYIAEHYYGNLGYEGEHLWEMLQGRYILAFLFEYAATLGLIDVAYLPPQGARRDFRDRWGTDDYSCLSRYDGLLYFRVNPLGAWCLDLTERYESPPLAAADVLQVLPNLDVVAKRPPLDAADRLLLERFAEQQSDAVWRLTAAKTLSVLEQGGSLDELSEFLAARAGAPLPQTVQVFLDDLRRRAGQLRDLGLARLVECADAALAQMLANDSQLRGKCQVAGERGLVFRAQDEAAVRKALRRLGYLLPPQSS